MKSGRLIVEKLARVTILCGISVSFFLVLVIAAEGILHVVRQSPTLQFEFLLTDEKQRLSSEYIFEKIRNPEIFGYAGYHIAVIGDSFSACDVFDQIICYPRLIHAMLEQNGKNVQVFDYASAGNNSDREFRYFVDKVLPTHPDLVIWQLYVNDVWENVLFPVYMFTKNDELQRVSGESNWAYKRQVLFNALPMKELMLRSYIVRWILRSYEYKSYDLSPYGDDNGRIEWGLQKIRLQIEAMNQLSKKYGFHVIYVHIPTQALFLAHTESATPQQQWMREYNLRIYAAIESMLQGGESYLPVRFLPLKTKQGENTPELVQNQYYLHGEDPNFLGDKHLSQDGNEVVAEQIVNQIHLFMKESSFQ